MPNSFYLYTADDTTEYKLSLDDEIASASGFDLASGSEPVVPTNMQPRYGVGINRDNYLTALLEIPFPTLASLSIALGSTVTVAGVDYELRELVGQAIGPNPFAGIVGPQGEQGEQGPPGELTYQQDAMSGDVAMTSSSTWYDACELTLVPGHYLLTAAIQFSTGASAARLAGRIASSGGTTLNAGAIYQATINQYTHLFLHYAFEVAGGSVTFKLQGASSVTNSTIRQEEPLSSTVGTYFIALKVG